MAQHSINWSCYILIFIIIVIIINMVIHITSSSFKEPFPQGLSPSALLHPWASWLGGWGLCFPATR